MSSNDAPQTTEYVRAPRWNDPEIQAAWQREVDAEVARARRRLCICLPELAPAVAVNCRAEQHCPPAQADSKEVGRG